MTNSVSECERCSPNLRLEDGTVLDVVEEWHNMDQSLVGIVILKMKAFVQRCLC